MAPHEDVPMDEAQDGVCWRADVWSTRDREGVGMFGPARFVTYLRWERWTVESTTPEGRWLESDGHRTWRKEGTFFCSPTKAEALAHLLVRKRRHVGHAKARLAEAESQLAFVTGSP